MRHDQRDTNPSNSAVANAVANLLGRFGVTGSDTQEAVLVAANEILAARSHRAIAVGVRWNELTIEAGGVDARFLRADLDQVLAAVNAAHPGAVERIIVRRPRATH
jgi:hypothetical protein